jgi:hypothetical protein
MRSTKQKQPVENTILNAIIQTKMKVEDYARKYGIVTWSKGATKDARLDN